MPTEPINWDAEAADLSTKLSWLTHGVDQPEEFIDAISAALKAAYERGQGESAEKIKYLEGEVLDHENAEAEVCGEDYSLKETFDAMVRQIDCHIDTIQRLESDRDRLAAENANWKRDNAVLVKLAEGKDAEIRRLTADRDKLRSIVERTAKGE